MATNSPSVIDPSEFYINPDRANHDQFVLHDIDRVVNTKWSSQVSSKFGVYKFLIVSEILARNCALVFLEHHQRTQHG
jgi:hypothetical protein